MISNIQGLRFLAAFGVCILHLGLFKSDPPPLFDLGGVGVDLFFVISGFIMVVSSQALFGQKGATATFLYRRITRIVPLYWLATLVFLGMLAWHHSTTPEIYQRFTAGMFFIPLNDVATYVPLLNPGWTLNHEMAFYVIFAVVVRFRQPIALAAACTIILILTLLGRAGIVHHLGVQLFWLNGLNLEFVWGIAAAVIYLRWKARPIAGAALALIGVAILMRASISVTDREFYLGLPAALIVFGCVCIPQIPATSLAGRIVNLLGDSSYALYLLHWILFMYWNNLPRPVLLGGAVILAIAVRLLIEDPLLAFFRRLRPSGLKPLDKCVGKDVVDDAPGIVVNLQGKGLTAEFE